MVVNSVWLLAAISALLSGKQWLVHWIGFIMTNFQRSEYKNTKKSLNYGPVDWCQGQIFHWGLNGVLLLFLLGPITPFQLTNSWLPLKPVLTQAGQKPEEPHKVKRKAISWSTASVNAVSFLAVLIMLSPFTMHINLLFIWMRGVTQFNVTPGADKTNGQSVNLHTVAM